jgi:hypothetical protein
MTALSYCTRANVKIRLGIDSGDTTDDTLLDSIVAQTNDWIELYCQRPVGPSNGGTATFDSTDDVSGYTGYLYVRRGIRTITSITVAGSTSGTPVAGTVDDFIILPRTQDRRPDWPGFYVQVKDTVVGAVSSWGNGYGDITIVGDFGWAAIPPAIVEIAEVIAVRTWHSRQAGQQDIIGSEANGEPTVSRYVSGKDRATLKTFRPMGGLVAV